MKKVLLLLIALIPYTILQGEVEGQTVTDTIWSSANLDGTISYRPNLGMFHLTTSSLMFSTGDGYDYIMGDEVFARNYLSFNLTNLPALDSSEIIFAEVGVYQFNTYGNDQPGVYPIWNVVGGDTHFCVLDHINYGVSLDLVDWTAGNPGDPQTLRTNIGIISGDTILGYKKLEVAQQVIADIMNNRPHSQYRMRFTIDRDYDLLGDLLHMASGNAAFTPKPYLLFQYDTTSMDIKYPDPIISGFILNQNYPNPFNPITKITYSITKSGNVKLIVFDVLGKRVQTLVNNMQMPGNHTVNFNGTVLPSGIYYYKIIFNNQSLKKKMVLVR